MTRLRARPITVVGLVLAVSACGAGGPSRTDTVAAVTAERVPERYADVAETAAQMGPTIDEWCATGDPAPALAAVNATRSAWTELSVFDFGPANDRRSMFVIDPPPRIVDIDELVTSEQPVDASSLRELAGADQRGLGTLDHLLSGEPTDRRCGYAAGAAELIVTELEALADAWPAYGSTISADDDAANVALRNIISESLFAAREAADAETHPALVAPLLAGVRWALVGDATTPGLSPLLDDATLARLDAEILAGDASELEITIATEVVGELGTTINFSDADGDG